MTKDVWFNDAIMDAAQKLICKALSKIGSFQSVLSSQRRSNYPFRAVNDEHLQLLHDKNNHWIISFCSNGPVQICDRLKNHSGRLTLRSLNALYRNFKDMSSEKLSFLPVLK